MPEITPPKFQYSQRRYDILASLPIDQRRAIEEGDRELEDYLNHLPTPTGGGLGRAKTFSFHGDGGLEIGPGDHESFGIVNIATETVQFSAVWGGSMFSWTPGDEVYGTIWISEDSTTYPGTNFQESDPLVVAAGTNTIFVEPGNTVQLHVVNYGAEGFHLDINVQLIETATWFFETPF
jgi:hypothetical protein